MGRSRHQPAPLRHLTCLVYKLLCLKNPAPGNSFGSGAMETHSLQEKLPGVSLGTWKPLQCHSRSEPLLSAASSLTLYNHLHWASSLPWIFYEFFYHGKLQTYPKVQPPRHSLPALKNDQRFSNFVSSTSYWPRLSSGFWFCFLEHFKAIPTHLISSSVLCPPLLHSLHGSILPWTAGPQEEDSFML